MHTHEKGELKVWWIPQLPMKPFEYSVSSPMEGFLVLDILSKYDLFQFDNCVKSDYSNAGGLLEYDLEMIDDDCDGWTEWYSPMGENMEFYINQENGLDVLNEDLKFQI